MSEQELKCFYFGCWNRAGHFLHVPGGKFIGRTERDVEYYGGHDRRVHIDGTLAPRKLARDGSLIWTGNFTKEERDRYESRSSEYPNGWFLRHELDNGFSVLQWWDQTQGDTRPGCNSTIMLEGKHTTEELFKALEVNFPHVLANLKKADVKLVEVYP